MSHSIADQKKMLARIRSQAEALEKSVAGNAECAAILQQIAAIRGAVNGLLTVVLEGQLHTHAVSNVPARQHQVEHQHLLHLLKVCLK